MFDSIVQEIEDRKTFLLNVRSGSGHKSIGLGAWGFESLGLSRTSFSWLCGQSASNRAIFILGSQLGLGFWVLGSLFSVLGFEILGSFFWALG